MEPAAAEEDERVTGGGSFLRVFRHRVFAMVTGAAFLSNIGNWMENGAANYAVVNALKDNLRIASRYSELLNFADFLPTLLLSLLAGVIADRVNLRRYLIGLQALACLLGAGLAAAAYMGWASPWVVIGFTFAEGVVWALNGPAWLSVVPHLVPRPELPSAVAASSMQFNMARVIGPVVAGVVVVSGGVSMAFAVNALTFFPLIYVFWRMPAGKPRKKTPGAKKPLVQELGAGLRLVKAHPGLRRVATMQAVTLFLAAPATGLLAPFVEARMNGNQGTFFWLMGAIGVGAALAAMTVRSVPAYYPRHHLIPLSLMLAAIFMLIFTLTRVPWMGFLVLVGMGFFWLLGLNSANAAMQLLAEDASRGRVLSVMMLCTQGLSPLGHLFAAGLANFMGPEWVMRWMEGALVLSAFGFLLWREPAIDAMTRRESPRLQVGLLQNVWEAVTAQSHWPVPEAVRDEVAREGGAVGTGERHG